MRDLQLPLLHYYRAVDEQHPEPHTFLPHVMHEQPTRQYFDDLRKHLPEEMGVVAFPGPDGHGIAVHYRVGDMGVDRRVITVLTEDDEVFRLSDPEE